MASYRDLRIGDVVGVRAGARPIYGLGAPGWFALRVASQREDQAEAWLRQRGVYAFHPVLMRRTVIRGQVREYPRRYLPGYVFARFPSAPVVHRVMGCAFIAGALALQSGEWGRIDPADLRSIHAMRRVDEATEAARRALNKQRRQAVALRAGDAALFRCGPLAGMRCEVVTVDGPAGLTVRLSLFGAPRAISADADDLVATNKLLTGGAGRA